MSSGHATFSAQMSEGLQEVRDDVRDVHKTSMAVAAGAVADVVLHSPDGLRTTTVLIGCHISTNQRAVLPASRRCRRR